MPPLSAPPALEDEDLPIDGQAMEAGDLEDGPEVLAPGGIEHGDVLDALFRDLRRGEHAKSVMVEAEMRRVIEASQSLGEGRFVEGLGQMVARVPAAVYHHWGQRHGYEIWNNPGDLIRFLERLNPGFMIRSRGKTQVVVQGRREEISARPDSGAGEAKAGAGMGPAPAPAAVRGRRGRWAA